MDGISDTFSVMERVRGMVVTLQAEQTALAMLLNRHPELRVEAHLLRVLAAEQFEEGEDSTDGSSTENEQ